MQLQAFPIGTFLFLQSFATASFAQCDRWQQRADYTMTVELDDQEHRFTGDGTLIYTNNSPDTLREVWFHMYFNAFRPGSEMDVRSRTIADPDDRVGSRIAELSPDQMGEIVIEKLDQDGRNATVEAMGTITKVTLARPLLPGKRTKLVYTFNGQVPVQIRRSGRDNAEGVAYSMTQWYPKLAHYDQRGWHAYPYVAREFHGVWGNFDVKLTLDSAYTIAATGVLQNPQQIGHGYDTGGKPVRRGSGSKLTWHFLAENVHDFAWAADKDYVHFTEQVPGGPLMHFFHKNDPELAAVWKELPEYMSRTFTFMNEHFGEYAWPQYSFVQGGDGGMEYPMMTLVTGKRRIGSLVGVSVHEMVHSWYYGMLASNEGRFPWMDEGFTQYAGSKVMAMLFDRPEFPHASAYAGYFVLQGTEHHEPPSVHADHFNTNRGYGITAYNFGEMFVSQLAAVVGQEALDRSMLHFYEACKFKHPEPIDFERVIEKQSGIEMDWYFDEWMNTTRTLDYAIQSVLEVNGELRITLERKGEMLMPVDVRIEFRNGSVHDHHIPLSLMRGARPAEEANSELQVLPAWQWTDPTYTFTVPGKIGSLAAVVLDPHHLQADVDRSNDRVDLPEGAGGFSRP